MCKLVNKKMSEVLSETNLHLISCLNFARDNLANFDLVLDKVEEWIKIFNAKTFLFFEKNKPCLDDTVFLHSFFQKFPENWKENKKYVSSMIFIFICYNLFEESNHKIFKTHVSKFTDAMLTLKDTSKQQIYWEYSGLRKVFHCEYFEVMWLTNPDRLRREKLREDDLWILSQKYGKKFIFCYIKEVCNFVIKQSERFNNRRQFFKDFLKEHLNEINEKEFNGFYIELIEIGILTRDFFVSSHFENFNSMNLLDPVFFRRLVEKSRGIPIHQDFLTKFLYNIDYKIENIFNFVSNWQEVNHPKEEVMLLFKRYIFNKDIIPSQFNSYVRLMNSINDEQLFREYIKNCKNFFRVAMLRNSSIIVEKFNLTIPDLMSFVQTITKYEFLYDINSPPYKSFLENFRDHDVYGLFILEKYIGHNIDEYIERIDSQENFSRDLIISVTRGMLRVKILHCILNKLPFEFKLSGRNATNNDIIVSFRNYHEMMYGNGLEEYSLIHYNKSFDITYKYLDTAKKISLMGFPFFGVKRINESIELKDTSEMIYVEFHNRFVDCVYPNLDKSSFKSFLQYFREKYKTNCDFFEAVKFNFKIFYNTMLISLDPYEDMQNLFIDETIQFVNQRYLDILKQSQYIARIKSFKAEEKAEEEITSIITSLKRKRDECEIFNSCFDALKNEAVPENVKKILKDVVSLRDDFFVNQFLAQNPNTIMKCQICCDFLKNSAFINFNCGHNCCAGCSTKLPGNICPHCREPITSRNSIQQIESVEKELLEKMKN